MKEILLTSSVLILALLVLRQGFRKRISRRGQYALWALVLVRLLVPGNLPAADFSVLSVSQPVRAAAEARLEENTVYVLPVQEEPISYTSVVARPAWKEVLPIEGHPVVSEDEKTLITYAFTLEEALDLAWKAGMAVMALWLAASNLGFWMKLRRARIPLEFPDCKRPVYLVEEGLVSPCLFGLIRPAIYLTPAALEDREGLRHILAHEEAHARQWDPLWSLLRGVCLAVYWFDPLVWLAARASKEDCELSCDELALRTLGEEERVPYGRTLLRLIPVKRSAGGVLLTATTMTSDKKRLAERITRIAENRKMKRAAFCAVLAVTVAVCAVTFTGCVAAVSKEPDVPAAPAEPADTPETPDTPSAAAPPGNAADTLPAGDPVLTILTDQAPYEPVPVEVLSPEHLFTDHHGERHHDNWDMVGGGCSTTEDCTTFAWNYGGNTYVSSHVTAMNAFTGDYFLCFPEQEYVEEAFTDLFGYDGVCITYEDQLETGTCTVNDYYIFQESEAGTEVYLLARMYGEAQRIDLDGNGTEELVSTDGWDRAQLVFQWGGQLYETDALAALREFWPELAAPVTPCAWSPEARCLQVQGIVSGGDGGFSASRALYFDGKNLLLCKPVREMTDHTLSGVQVPAAVLETALETVRTEFARWRERDNASADRPAWDDYCIMDLFPVYPAETDRIPEGLDLVVYQVQYEFHTSAPERVMLAGGIYVDEDGWVGGFSSDSPAFLLFQRPEDVSYVYLGSAGYDFDPGAPAFVRWVNGVLGEHGLPQMPVPEV